MVCLIPSCLLCISNCRTCVEKLIVTLKPDRKGVCSVLHEELVAE